METITNKKNQWRSVEIYWSKPYSNFSSPSASTWDKLACKPASTYSKRHIIVWSPSPQRAGDEASLWTAAVLKSGTAATTELTVGTPWRANHTNTTGQSHAVPRVTQPRNERSQTTSLKLSLFSFEQAQEKEIMRLCLFWTSQQTVAVVLVRSMLSHEVGKSHNYYEHLYFPSRTFNIKEWVSC